MVCAADDVDAGHRGAELTAGSFDVTLQMIQAGVQLYLAYDPNEDEPEGLIAEILYTARDIWRDSITHRC